MLHVHVLHILQDGYAHLVRAVLQGRMTIRDAQNAAAGTLDISDAVLGARYNACHKRLLKRHPDILRAPAGIAELESELDPMREDVRIAFMQGSLTLPQTRYADQVCRRDNTALPKLIERSRKVRSGAYDRHPPQLLPLDSPERQRLLASIPSDVALGFADTSTEHLALYVGALNGSRNAPLSTT